MNTGVSKAHYQFSNEELKEIRELLLVAMNPNQPHSMTTASCNKHIQTINQILSDRSK